MSTVLSVLVFDVLAVAALLGLRFVFLRLSKRYQPQYGYSDQAITDMSVVLPLGAFIAIFIVGVSWLTQ
jgi:hypothetical protein